VVKISRQTGIKKPMKTLRRCWLGAGVAGVVLVALAGCQGLNFGTQPTGAGLEGKRTFAVAEVYGGGGGVVTGAGDAASAAAAQAIRGIFEQHGYVEAAMGVADFQVSAAWQYNTSTNPFYGQSQLGAAPVTPVNVQQITLSIVVRDKTGNDILWRAEMPFPITAGTLTPDGAVTLVRQALKNLPEAKPAASKP
jgi:hypothetical protein